MKTWRYIPFSIHTGAENMALDEAIMLNMPCETNPQPVLRFYGWKPATLSLGYAQSYAKEVVEEECVKAGVDVVRRPTGGRAVLHQYELTYSVVAPEEDDQVNGTIIESYLKISQALLKGFQALGISAEMVAHSGVGKESSAACFDAPSWYELVVDGMKLVGSAQVRKDGMLLQHGSIPLHFDAELLFRLLKFSKPEVRQRFLTGFMQKACALDEVWLNPVSREELEREICIGFQEVMKIEFLPSKLKSAEQVLVPGLVQKYQSSEWTKKR
ncbi:lipoate--protein ligase family protein [Desulfitobacterium sp.]|uniref:lipoate--protein ligase family protein n=1 Tax=Desulfitobacterium sp. TaxID=49981 RepID=UPI002B5AA495|nr:lipoate--protein ligase family protein [Desulfitobacterium sp.]HVJ48227.1 lipoate--protein ligase family protein [Desulfitobacterium sp.]